MTNLLLYCNFSLVQHVLVFFFLFVCSVFILHFFTIYCCLCVLQYHCLLTSPHSLSYLSDFNFLECPGFHPRSLPISGWKTVRYDEIKYKLKTWSCCVFFLPHNMELWFLFLFFFFMFCFLLQLLTRSNISKK